MAAEVNEIRARVRVAADHKITGVAPPDVPVGEHEVTIRLGSQDARKLFRLSGSPVDDGPWDDRVTLRREDMYGEDGR